MMRASVLAASACLLAAPAAAQIVASPDCAAPDLAPPEIAACAEEVFLAAEAELDATYRLAFTRAQAFDAETAAQGLETALTLEEGLRAAQEAWLAYRDAECDAEAALLRGGTGAPAAGTVCRARLNLARTEALQGVVPDL